MCGATAGRLGPFFPGPGRRYVQVAPACALRSAQKPVLFGRFVRVRVRFRPRRQEDREVELPDAATAGDLVDAVGESRDIMVVVRAGVPIAEDEALVEGEEILLLSAASGG